LVNSPLFSEDELVEFSGGDEAVCADCLPLVQAVRAKMTTSAEAIIKINLFMTFHSFY